MDQIPAITALTWNPSRDVRQGTARCCGGGINLAKCTSTLGIPTLATGFVGQQDHADYQDLPRATGLEGILHVDLVRVPGACRRVQYWMQDGKEHSSFGLDAMEITHQHIDALSDRIRRIRRGHCVAFSGSLARQLQSRIVGDLAEVAHQNHGLVAVNCRPSEVKQAIRAGADVLQLNMKELARYLGRPDLTLDQARSCIEGILPRESIVVVSLGADGVLASRHRKSWHSKCPDPPGGVLTTVGCGDSFMAALVAALLSGLSTEDAIIQATAAASDQCEHDEPGLVDPSHVRDLRRMVSFRAA